MQDLTPRLRLVGGGPQWEAVLDEVRVVAAPASAPPFEVDAEAVEEDTFLVLSARPEFEPSDEPPSSVLRDLEELEPEPVGSVVVREGRPLRLLAIVHDLAREPTCRQEWVESALGAIFTIARMRGLRSIALPMIGTLHGPLDMPRFVAALDGALRGAPAGAIERLWIVTEPDRCREVLELLLSRPGR